MLRAILLATCDREYGGAERDRTADPLLAKQVLSQLSYSPALYTSLSRREVGQTGRTADAQKRLSQYMSPPRRMSKRLSTSPPIRIPSAMVGLGRVELPTSRLSGVRSNHLSYRPYGPVILQLFDN